MSVTKVQVASPIRIVPSNPKSRFAHASCTVVVKATKNMKVIKKRRVDEKEDMNKLMLLNKYHYP